MARVLGLPPKLALALMLPALAALVVGSIPLWQRLESLAGQSATDQLQSTLPALSKLIEPELASGPRELQRTLRALRGPGELRLTIVRGDGIVIADSARTWPEVGDMDNHADRPEIEQAFASGRGTSIRHSSTLDQPFAYAATLITDPGGRLFVVRIARPISELAALKERLAQALMVAALLSIAVSLLVSWQLGRALFRPLEELAMGTSQLAGGQLSRRLRVPDDRTLAPLARQINTLVAAVEEKMDELAGERNRLELVGESMDDAVVVTREDGRVRLANPAFLKLFHLERRVEGASLLELTHLPELDALVGDTLERGGVDEIEVELRLAGSRTLAVTSSALRDRSGAVVVMHDVTELLLVRDIRRDFVANVSHELKTPLAAIRAYAETLDGGVEDPALSDRFTAKILDQCSRLEALLDDLLTLARFEGSVQAREKEPVQLGAFLSDAHETLTAGASEQEITIDLTVDDDPEILGDPEALRKICVNLLDNAIKYNRPGGTVRVLLRRLGDEAVLEVADSGQGIPESAIPRLFERFYRVDKGRGRGDGGTGLGLAIVKHAAQLHAGRVEVESSLGTGSTFRVFLPLAQ